MKVSARGGTAISRNPLPGPRRGARRLCQLQGFLDPWEPLAEELRKLWEPLANRGESSILAIHGQQGAGKTLLTKKLTQDFEATRVSSTITPDDNNIWHRVTGRHEKKLSATPHQGGDRQNEPQRDREQGLVGR